MVMYGVVCSICIVVRYGIVNFGVFLKVLFVVLWVNIIVSIYYLWWCLLNVLKVFYVIYDSCVFGGFSNNGMELLISLIGIVCSFYIR